MIQIFLYRWNTTCYTSIQYMLSLNPLEEVMACTTLYMSCIKMLI